MRVIIQCNIKILCFYIIGAHVILHNGESCSHKGFKPIDTIQECRALYGFIQSNIRGARDIVNLEHKSNFPAGCYVSIDAIFFNTNRNGLPRQDTRQVCIGKIGKNKRLIECNIDVRQ